MGSVDVPARAVVLPAVVNQIDRSLVALVAKAVVPQELAGHLGVLILLGGRGLVVALDHVDEAGLDDLDRSTKEVRKRDELDVGAVRSCRCQQRVLSRAGVPWRLIFPTWPRKPPRTESSSTKSL